MVLFGAISLFMHALNSSVAGLNSSAELFVESTVLGSVLLDLISDILDVVLKIGTGMFALCKHGLVLL
jgi:hypothetical protein